MIMKRIMWIWILGLLLITGCSQANDIEICTYGCMAGTTFDGEKFHEFDTSDTDNLVNVGQSCENLCKLSKDVNGNFPKFGQ